MHKTLVVWRRLGKEHREDDGFRLNAEDVVLASLEVKIKKFRETPEDDWRWWKVSDHLIVERPLATKHCGPDAIVYYLPRLGLVLLENARFRGLEEYPWYVHIGKTEFSEDLRAWVFTDLFVDVLVQEDCRTSRVVDLDDLGEALHAGVISADESVGILKTTQRLLDSISIGEFPPSELKNRREILMNLNWA